MVELAFLKVLMLIKKVHVESVLFATNCFFSYKGFNFQPALCKGFHDLSIMSLNFIDIAILNIHCVDYHRIINRISQSDAINVLQYSDLSEKSESS